MIKKYRKNNEIVKAVQLNGKMTKELEEFLSDANYGYSCNSLTTKIMKDFVLEGPEGNVTVMIEDYIIKGVNGEYYPCKPDIFEKTYEEID